MDGQPPGHGRDRRRSGQWDRPREGASARYGLDDLIAGIHVTLEDVRPSGGAIQRTGP
jgi:hypothetical protein